MTQALINKMNIVSETNVSLTDKMSKTTGMDFGKIFEKKTGEIEKKADNSIQKTDNNNKITNESEKKTNNVCTKEDFNKTDDNKEINITNNSANTDNTTEETENNNIQKPIQGIVIKPDIEDSDDKKSTDSDNETTATDDKNSELITTDEESDYTDETTITEEDPTIMYNELITLENPTAILLLQSQMQKVLSTNTQNEQTEIADSNSSTGTTGSTTSSDISSNNTSTNTTVFKQLDAQYTKNTAAIVKNSPAEITRSKTEAHKSSNVLNENVIKELNVEVISAESEGAGSSMEDLMQNQSPQEQTARIMIQGDIKYDEVASEATRNISQPKTTTTTNITPGRIIEQVTKQLEGMFNNSKLNMVLNPGSLGKLNLQLVNSKEGIIAQFTVTTQETRDLLMKGLDGLKESLLAQGINVDNVSVRLENAESEYESDYTEQEHSQNGNKHQGTKKQKENGKNFEEMMFNLENEDSV